MDEFKNVIEQLIGLFKQLTKIEQVKLNAVAGKHVGTVEDCVTQQQALLLKLRGLEQARERAQKKAGYEGLQFRQILESVSDNEREELFPLFDGLSREIQMFREVNESSNEILRTHLHSIDKTLRKKTGNTYNGEGKSETGVRHMTSRRV
ncbi:flagellar export chaperone FlgN [Lachnospiraceae bacterium MD308]|nr:flagellar export chaperone FlgN [Lachnospiraceae bacterium MD308]MCI8581372.1 flagellar protein FlgN [Dorea sp.]